MTIVIDASAILAVAFSELAPVRQAALFARIGLETALVPVIFGAEVANGLEIGRRRGRIGEPEISAFVADLVLLPIGARSVAALSQIALLQATARLHGLSAYDASYLHLAESENLELITLDATLERAARNAGVPVSQP